jgi:hypothetical protein
MPEIDAGVFVAWAVNAGLILGIGQIFRSPDKRWYYFSLVVIVTLITSVPTGYGYPFYQGGFNVLTNVIVGIVMGHLVYWMIGGYSDARLALRRLEKVIEDVRGVLVDFAQLDGQIAYLLWHFMDGDHEKFAENYHGAMIFALDQLVSSLSSASGNRINASILIANKDVDGFFKVVGCSNIAAYLVPEMERRFKYGNTLADVEGIAGLVAHRGEDVYIPDLTDKSNRDAEKWVPLYGGDKREGSILCTPIMRLGDRTNEWLALVSLSSPSKKAFAFDVSDGFFRSFENKIKALLYIRAIAMGWGYVL